MTRFGRKVGVHRKIKGICGYCGVHYYDWDEKVFCSQKCYGDFLKGRSFPNPQTSEEKRQRMMGANNPMWCGGDSDKERRNSAYKEWRIAVFERDFFICQRCGYYNGNGTKRRDLHAHHRVKWIDSIELRYTVENGVTLCVPCHIREHIEQKESGVDEFSIGTQRSSFLEHYGFLEG